MSELVSILIPAYNAEQWIRETLDSAVHQSWLNKEIIVVDDGSTDRTLSLAKEFASFGVRVVSQKNQGAASARNHALSLARGSYIQWLDADDLLAPDKVAAQMALVETCRSRRVLFSSCWGYFMYRPSKANFRPTHLWHDLTPLEWMLRKWEGNLHMQTATWLVSRELTAAAGPWDTRLLGDDDGEYFSRVIRASEEIKFVPGAKTFYRITGVNRLSYIGGSNKKIDAQFLGMTLQIGNLRSMANSDRVQKACLNYLQTWLIHFYPERLDIVHEAQQLASKLGGRLTLPTFSWKYAWIQSLFGWRAAKNVQLRYNSYKSQLKRRWDKIMARMERQGI